MTRGESIKQKRKDVPRGTALRELRKYAGSNAGVRLNSDGRKESYVFDSQGSRHLHWGRTWRELVDKAQRKWSGRS